VACADRPSSTVVIKPFTGNVPRIPGNYEAEARLPRPEPRLSEPSSSTSSDPYGYGQSDTSSECDDVSPRKARRKCERRAERRH
jgi:hypothetical protein